MTFGRVASKVGDLNTCIAIVNLFQALSNVQFANIVIEEMSKKCMSHFIIAD